MEKFRWYFKIIGQAPLALMTVLFLLLICAPSMGQINEEKISWDLTSKVENQKIKKVTSTLAMQKTAENNRNWSDCSKNAKINVNKFPEVRPWVYLSWFNCASMQLSKKKTTQDLELALARLEKDRHYLHEGPWHRELRKKYFSAHLALLEIYGKEKLEKSWQHINALMGLYDRLDREQKAKIYYWVSELALLKHQQNAAKFYLQESLQQKEVNSAREKLNSLLLALNEKVFPPEQDVKVSGVSEDEQKYEDRFKDSLKNNDLISFLEDGVSYLDRFPNGVMQKTVQDKIQEVYQNLIDSSSDPERALALKNKALDVLYKADSSRLYEWVRGFHRRGDFVACLRLGARALKDLEKSQHSAILLYILGRSAQFLGEYKEAEKYFEKYIQHHSGGDDLAEVYMRLALVYFRMEKYSSSIATLERLLSLNGGEKFELTARYWLVRSLQQLKNDRAGEEIEKIQFKYPYSYYALRLDAERSGNTLEKKPIEIQSLSELKGSLFFLPEQKKSWERIKILKANSWSAEIIQELQMLPLPSDGKEKIIFAQKLSQGGAYPTVIKLVNEGLDLEPQYRSLEILTISFPKDYESKINAEAVKYNLSPYLVRSLIRQESAFGIKAVSTSSAIGLMQMIPPTAAEIAGDLKINDLIIPDEVFSPELNIEMGTYYLAKVIKEYGGNVAMGLAAYNAGPARLRTFVKSRTVVSDLMTRFSSDPKDEIWIDELPWAETTFYVKAILRNVLIYKLLDQGRVQLSTVIWQDLAASVK